MRAKRYFIVAAILLGLLGAFLMLGIISSRMIMMNLIKDQARSFLTIVAQVQENSIRAEGEIEDIIVERLINTCQYLESTEIGGETLRRMRESQNYNSITLFDVKQRRPIITSGQSLRAFTEIDEPIFFNYFEVARRKYLSFVYRGQKYIFYIEVPAEDIELFRQDYGINKIIGQVAMNPMVKYLVLQDQKGIIFATPNVTEISRIDDDPTLRSVLEKNIEDDRFVKFENEQVLELVRPFVMSGRNFGLLRIGIDLRNYYHQVRATERQLILLFVILFCTGFFLFFLFTKYQSYSELKVLFEKTLSTIEDGIIAVDHRGIITGVNKMFSTVTNFEEKSLVGKEYAVAFPEDPFNVADVLKNARKISDEKVVFDRSIQYSSYPLFDEKNKVRGAISVLRDVTKLREFEKKREENERLQFLGNLVANFAHEIKNPLNGLSIATQRLVREFPAQNDDLKRLTSAMKNEIESLNKILNDFLSLARPRLKERKQLDISRLVLDLLIIIEEQVKLQDIKLKENIARGLKTTGNAEDLKRAILNILLNAIDALSAVSERKREMAVELVEQDQTVCLTISDNGEGMDEQEIQRIFTPYFTTKKGGTGLGLYIAQEILKSHQARIDVQSKKGHGTTFQLVFKSMS